MKHSGLERIVFFSDAVMVIAITLLAIDLKVPEIAAAAAAVELPRSLSELAPRFLSFIISFFVIGICWMSHHRHFRFIKRYDGGLIMLNLLFLLFIVLMPFVASLFGQYYYLPLGMSIYAVAVAATGLSMAALWWYASHRHRLVDEHLDEQFIRARSLALAVPLLFLVSIPYAFVSRTLVIAIWCTLPLVSFALLKVSERRQARGQDASTDSLPVGSETLECGSMVAYLLPVTGIAYMRLPSSRNRSTCPRMASICYMYSPVP